MTARTLFQRKKDFDKKSYKEITLHIGDRLLKSGKIFLHGNKSFQRQVQTFKLKGYKIGICKLYF